MDLLDSTEYVGIILLESSDTGKSTEGSTKFISVEDIEISETDGEFLVGSEDGVEHQAVSWAIHGLQSKVLFFDLEGEHVGSVFAPVTGGLP